MATFPPLTPSTRTYSPGAFPHTTHRVYNGSEARVRHSNTVLGVRLRLFFPAITTDQLRTVIEHYSGQQGRFLPFAIPTTLLSGTTTPSTFTPTGHQWRYAAKPSVNDISIVGGTNRHNLTIELESVPPENAIVAGPRLTVRITVEGGSTAYGDTLDIFASVDGGYVPMAVTVESAATVDGGDVSNLQDVTITVDGGYVPIETGIDITATTDGGYVPVGIDIDITATVDGGATS